MSTIPPRPTLRIVARRGPIEPLVPELSLHPGAQVVESLRVGGAALVRRLASHGDDARAQLAVARAHARLDEGLPLPVFGAFALVTNEALEGHDEQALAPGGAKARIELVAGALRVGRLEQAHHALRDACGALRRGVVAPLVDEEEIEVRTVANLAAAELAPYRSR